MHHATSSNTIFAQDDLASASVITLAQIVEEKDNDLILADDKVIQIILQVRERDRRSS